MPKLMLGFMSCMSQLVNLSASTSRMNGHPRWSLSQRSNPVLPFCADLCDRDTPFWETDCRRHMFPGTGTSRSLGPAQRRFLQTVCRHAFAPLSGRASVLWRCPPSDALRLLKMATPLSMRSIGAARGGSAWTSACSRHQAENVAV